jgi:hypothetical protein
MSDMRTSESYEAELWTQVLALDAARARIETATRELEAHRDAVDKAMRRYGTVLSLEEKHVSRDVVRRLYWQSRDVRVDSIARAFAIEGGAGQVHSYAGVDHVDVPCPDGCGRTVRLTARTAKLRPCNECEERRKQARHEDHQDWQISSARKIRERDEWVRSELAAGRTVEELYVELVSPWDTNGPLEKLRTIAAENE